MAAVIIRKKDVERLGKELIKEVFVFLHNEYILSNFEEMKKEKEKFLRNLVLNKFRSVNYNIKQKENSLSIEYENFDENFDESKYEEKLKLIKDEIENERLDTDFIFQTLNNLDLDEEIGGDLEFKRLAFLDIFKVFNYSYGHLKD